MLSETAHGSSETLNASTVRRTRTKNLILDRLVLSDSLSVALALVLLATEVLDSLVVEQAISMYPTGDLRCLSIKCSIDVLYHAPHRARSSASAAWYGT